MHFTSNQASRDGRRNRPFARRSRVLMAAAVFGAVGGAGHAMAGNLYWDVNGTTPGSGVTAASADWVNGNVSAFGTWDGTTSNWNSDATGGAGGSFTANVGASNTAVFSAGTDATSNYFVVVPDGGSVTAGGLSISQGSVIIPGYGNAGGGGVHGGNSPSFLNIGSGTFNIDVASGASLALGYAAIADVDGRFGYDRENRGRILQQRYRSTSDAHRQLAFLPGNGMLKGARWGCSSGTPTRCSGAGHVCFRSTEDQQ